MYSSGDMSGMLNTYEISYVSPSTKETSHSRTTSVGSLTPAVVCVDVEVAGSIRESGVMSSIVDVGISGIEGIGGVGVEVAGVSGVGSWGVDVGKSAVGAVDVSVVSTGSSIAGSDVEFCAK